MSRWATKFFTITAMLAFIWGLITLLMFPRIGVLFGLWRYAHRTMSILVIGGLALLITIGLLFGARQLASRFQKRLSTRLSWLILIGELVFFVTALTLVLWYCGYQKPVDDAGYVFNWLHGGTKVDIWEHPTWINQYMYSNPQNLLLAGVYWGLGLVFKQAFFPVVVSFLLLQAATVALSFATLRRFGVDNIVALLSVQVWFLAVQVWWHAAIAYTDTLLLFFMVATLHAFAGWVKTQHYSSLAWTCVLATLSFLSKGTGLILVIALAVYLVITEKGFRRLLFVTPVIALGVGNFCFHQAVNATGVYPDSGYGQPNTHYLMMGLSNTPQPAGLSIREKLHWSVGIYETEDQQYSWRLLYHNRLSKSQTEKKQLSVALKRLKAMSPKQLLVALNDKVSVVWSSGDVKASFSLLRGMTHVAHGQSLFTSKVIGTFNYLWMTVGQIVLYLGILWGCWRQRKQATLLCTVFLTGYFAFMILWEANPRYSLAIAPLAMILLAQALAPKPNQRLIQTDYSANWHMP